MKQSELMNQIHAVQSSGYRHHNFESEGILSSLVLRGKHSGVHDTLNLETYADILGPNRLRAMKNGLICYLAVICRSAIQLGVDAETSFSASDLFINQVELCSDEQRIAQLLEEIQKSYSNMVDEEEFRAFSLPVTRAIRFIRKNLYEPCRVEEVARKVGLNPQYFSRLFKAETGLSPATYIRQKKMQEAKDLLLQTGASVGEVADMLGYCDSAHFICMFKKEFGKTPKQFALGSID